MNFIWDIVLQAEAQGIDKADLFFQQAEQYSPYCEQAFAYINQPSVTPTATPTVIELNALYRFSHIFQHLLHPDLLTSLNDQELTEFATGFFDILLHLLSETDLKHGLTQREYFIRRLRAELLTGVYGRVAAAAMASLDHNRQTYLTGEILTQIQTGAHLRTFVRTVRTVFTNSILYQSTNNHQELRVYLGVDNSVENKRVIELLLALFLPLGFSIKIFWQYHFGILGVDATMQLDAIALL